MRTVVHLSDLHFGADDPRAADALLAAVERIRPDVVAVSGDLTQRARPLQFRRARAFLDALSFPRIVVPGNHDVPLFNIVLRFTAPLRRFRRAIERERHPMLVDAEVALIGADTTRSFTIKDGGLTAADVRRIAAALERLPAGVLKIVVCHHPFDTPATGAARLTAPPADRQALNTLVAAGVDVFLTGHLHLSYVGHTATRYLTQGRSAIVVEAGSATSTRVRGEPNSFNVLRVQADDVSIERLRLDAGARTFASAGSDRYVRRGADWVPAPEA